MRDILSIFFEIALRWMSQNLCDDLVNVGSGIGFFASCNKPLSEPMFTDMFSEMFTTYGVKRPQWVNDIAWSKLGNHWVR